MFQNDFNNYTYSEKFKKILNKYEEAADSNTVVYMEADDLIDIAEYYHLEKKTEQAVRAAEYCLCLHPDDSNALYFLARLYVSEYQDPSTAQDYLNMVPEHSKTSEWALIMAEIHLSRQELSEALSVFEQEYQHIKTGEGQADDAGSSPYEDDAETYHDTESYPDAETYYDDDDLDEEGEQENILETFPLDVSMLLCDYNYFEQAKQWFELCAAPIRGMEFEYWETLGRISMFSGEYATAIEGYNKALDYDAYSPITWLQLCDAQIQNNQMEDALQSTEFVLALKPDLAEGLLLKGLSLFGLGRWKDSIQVFKTYAAKHPDSVRPYMMLAAIHFEAEEPQTGAVYLQTVLSMTQNDLTLIKDEGIMVYDAGMRYGAFIIFTAVLKLYQKDGMQTKNLPIDLLDYLIVCCDDLGLTEDMNNYLKIKKEILA